MLDSADIGTTVVSPWADSCLRPRPRLAPSAWGLLTIPGEWETYSVAATRASGAGRIGSSRVIK
jgi:hypothetical protein